MNSIKYNNKNIVLNISLLNFSYPVAYGSIERICRRIEILLKKYSVILLCNKIDKKLKERFNGDIFYYEEEEKETAAKTQKKKKKANFNECLKG